MKRIGSIAVWIVCVASLGSASSVAAQAGAPDMREIFPYLMLVIDTSGSMERMPTCECEDLACRNCLPVCNPSSGGTPEKNRWATTLEALTGTFNDFKCEPLARTVPNGATYDLGYYLDYHQPWDCIGQTAGTKCTFNAVNGVGDPISTRDQNADGILDEYKGRLNFGLMTFDGNETYTGADRLVPVSQFNTSLSEDVQGLWSYGGGKSFHYPNCTTDYMMDTGARSSVATEGSLVSLNSCYGTPNTPSCPSWCGACWNSDPTEITNQLNEDIQEALLQTRPYGGTPIAGSLDDLYSHFKSDLTDTFSGCRNRFALLMTDGEPDLDYRDLGCDCNQGTDPLRCGPPPNDPDQMHCPYPTAEQVAFDLVHGRGANPTAAIERLFVVGMAVDDPNTVLLLNKIARAGCTAGAACVDPVTNNEALFANDLTTLVSNIGNIIGRFLHPISRSVPLFVSASLGSGSKQYQVGTGFELPLERGAPWTGLIERRRFTCNTTTFQPVAENILAIDQLHDVVRNQTSPTLITTLPDSGFSANGPVYGSTSGTPCGVITGSDLTGCPMTALNSSTVDTVAYGLNPALPESIQTRQDIIDWMYGSTPIRAGKRLGDIYHSSPVVLNRPQFDTVDEAFNEFRDRDVVKNRPVTLFVNTNDGMIRAITIEPYTAPGAPSIYTTSYTTAGTQLWGFVPPLLVDDLEDNLTDHRMTMDGTAVIKDVYFNRIRGARATTNADQYHSVLITGMRGGGQGPTNAYVALDVTNPTAPKFLWQFTDPEADDTNFPALNASAMGKTYAQPGITQAIYQFDPGTGTSAIKNGAVAILPGGAGLVGNSGVTGDCTNGVTNPSMRTGSNRPFSSFESTSSAATGNHRTDIRCWRKYGRALYFVDIETGRLIKKIHLDSAGKFIFPSPLISTPAIFPGEIGTLASQAYVTDADGVIWRIDMSATDPLPADPMNGWTVRPFHDMFWDRSPTAGEVTYEAPILSVDEDGRPIIIAGTGDTDNFNKTTVENRVVSMTEVIDTTTGVPAAEKYKAAFNWEKRVKPTGGLVPSELVTGNMALFGGQLFFPTFISVSGSDACDVGKGRIFAVDYIAKNLSDVNQTGSTPITTYGPAEIQGVSFTTTDSSNSVVNVTAADAVPNLLVLGLTVSQRPSCSQVDTTNFDAFGEDIGAMSQLEQPPMYLSAQGGGTASLLNANANTGARLQGIDLRLTRPRTTARVLSWATSVE